MKKLLISGLIVGQLAQATPPKTKDIAPQPPLSRSSSTEQLHPCLQKACCPCLYCIGCTEWLCLACAFKCGSTQ